jgi:hypothetical protein
MIFKINLDQESIVMVARDQPDSAASQLQGYSSSISVIGWLWKLSE